MIESKVEASLTLALLDRVRKMRAAGHDVASFAAGEPDFPTPSLIIDRAVEAMRNGDTRYVATPGIEALREAIAEDYRTRLESPWVTKENVLVSAGAKQGIYLVLAALLKAEDEVLVPMPYWVSYPHLVHSALGREKLVPTQEANGFFPTVQELEEAYTPKSKALIFSSPGNPTGCMIKKEQLQEIVSWCKKRKVTLIYDELYERLRLSDQKHICPLSLVTEEGSEYIISVNAFSKSLAMTGWRLGYVVTHRDNIKPMSALHGQMMTCLPGFVQQAALAGLAQADQFLAPVISEYKRRLEIMLERISKIPNLRALKPEGAFYVCVDVRQVMAKKKIATDKDFAEQLLNEKLVVALPGSSMGMDGWLRLSFATHEIEIRKGLDRLAEFCAK